MDGQPLVSILINNYNYGRFLAEAIDSALDQTYARVEVIVVDDGSTDESREVIARYGDRIVPVLKENGGQASAFNAGFAASRGGLICFLDADDWFCPSKIDTIVSELRAKGLMEGDVLAYHPLDLMDEAGAVLGLREPTRQGCHGNYYEFASKYRYVPYTASTTSGTAITRSLARRILPLPERFPSGADNFLVRGGALLGSILSIDMVLGRYRAHGQNRFWENLQTKPEEFWVCEEQFLNSKLVESGLAPVIARDHSMCMRNRYFENRDSRRLLALAIGVPRHHFDMRTLRFSLKTLGLMAVTLVRRPGKRLEHLIHGY